MKTLAVLTLCYLLLPNPQYAIKTCHLTGRIINRSDTLLLLKKQTEDPRLYGDEIKIDIFEQYKNSGLQKIGVVGGIRTSQQF